MITHNNPEFLKELFKFFPDKEAGIRDCYFKFMKSVASADGFSIEQAPSLETFISKQGLQNFLNVTQRMVGGGNNETFQQCTSNTTVQTDPQTKYYLPQGSNPINLGEKSLLGIYKANTKITGSLMGNLVQNQVSNNLQQIETLPEIQMFLDKIKEEVICDNYRFMNFIKSYQSRAQTNLNFKQSMARMEQQTIANETEIEKRLSQQGIDTTKLECFNGIIKPVDALSIGGLSAQKNRYNGQGYKEPAAICDPTAIQSHVKDIIGKATLGFKNSCWIILTGQKPTSGVQDLNSKNDKSKDPYNQKNQNWEQLQSKGAQKEWNTANNSSMAQMQRFGNNIPTSSAPPKTDNRGTGVRASTAEREPGSTNINFLQQKQMIQIQLPQKRYGHSSTIIDNRMFIFGGAYRKGNGASNFHSFHECNLKLDSQKEDLFKWRRIQGEAPKTRDSHSCIGFLDQLLIFGGSYNSKSYNDLYKFSITNKIWTKLECIFDAGHQPKAREGHISILIDGDKMLVHGGINENQDCFNDAFVLVGLHQEIDQSQSEIRFDEKGGISNSQELKNRRGKFEMLRWFKCSAEGDVPSARDSHSATICNNQIYLFGGQDNDENLLNDFYRITMTEGLVKTTNPQTGNVVTDRSFKLTYKLISVKSPIIPIKRSSHSMNLYLNRWLVLIGGETSIDTPLKNSKNEASNMNDQDELQFNKSIEDASEQLHSSQEESNNKALGDVWLYDTILNTWNEINPTVKVQSSFNSKKMRKSFEPRMAHSADVFGNYIIIFGGYSSATNAYSPNNFCLLSLSGCTDYMLQKPLTMKMLRDSQKPQQEQIQQAAPSNLKIQIIDNAIPKSDKLITQINNQMPKIKTVNSNVISEQHHQSSEKHIKNKLVAQKNQNIQTIDNSSQLTKIHQKNDKIGNRLDFQFIYKLAQQIKSPIQLIVELLKCQINQYQSHFQQIERFEQSRQIINLEEFQALDLNIQLCNHEQQDINILFIKDNGPGMSHSDLKEALTGQSLKHDVDRIHDSSNLDIYKYAALKLANQTLIITRTQQISTRQSIVPQFVEEVHIGMLSTKFIKDSCSQSLIAPIVSFEVVKNNQPGITDENQGQYVLVEKTPLSNKFLSLILGYIGIFPSIEELKQDILNNSYPKNCNKFQTGTEIYLCELQQNYNSYETDIFLINDKFKKDNKDLNLQTQTTSQIEDLLNENVQNSLVTLIKYSYIDFPNNINLKVNNDLVQKENPFSMIIQIVDEDENLAIKGQSDNYRYWIISQQNLNQLFGYQNQYDEQNIQQFEGLLIYHGNEFIMKDELAQPINSIRSLNNSNKRVHSQTNDVLYGLIMVMKQNENELAYDKQDFLNQAFLNQIREDICRTYLEKREEEILNEIEHPYKKQKIEGQYNQMMDMNPYNQTPVVFQQPGHNMQELTKEHFDQFTPEEQQMYLSQMCALPNPMNTMLAFPPADFYMHQLQHQQDPENTADDEFDMIEQRMTENVEEKQNNVNVQGKQYAQFSSNINQQQVNFQRHQVQQSKIN